MTVHLKPVVTLALLCLALPGCSSLFGSNKMAAQTGTAQQMQVAAKAAEARPAVHTMAGRSALDQGSAGIAIESFTRAVTSGEAPAPAFNGLGVAYARIGRYDLAQRYFERAAQIDPVDTRYQANLARLMRSPLYARRFQADETRAMLAKAEGEQAKAAQTRQAAAAAPLQRIGGNQFTLRTVAPAAGSAPVRTAMVVSRAKPAAPVTAKSVEAAFDASVGKAESAAPAEEQAKARTILFKTAAVAKP